MEKQPLLDFIRFVENEDPNGRVSSNEGGWQSHDFIAAICDINPLKEVKDKILLFAYECADAYGFKDYVLRITNLWINVNRKGNSNVLHTHPGGILSGAYYVDLPSCCHGPLSLLKPFDMIHIKESWGCNMNFDRAHENDYNDDEYDYYPKEDSCVIFPANLMHRVHQNSSDEDRISISFNIATYSTHYNELYPSEGPTPKSTHLSIT